QMLLQKRTELEEGVGAFPCPPATLGELHAVLGPEVELRSRKRALQDGRHFNVVACHRDRDCRQMFVGSSERCRDLQGHKLGHQGKSVVTSSATARCTSASSVMARQMATSQARRASIPRAINCPAYTSKRVLTPSSKLWCRRCRTLVPSVARSAAMSGSTPLSCAIMRVSASCGG